MTANHRADDLDPADIIELAELLGLPVRLARRRSGTSWHIAGGLHGGGYDLQELRHALAGFAGRLGDRAINQR